MRTVLVIEGATFFAGQWSGPMPWPAGGTDAVGVGYEALADPSRLDVLIRGEPTWRAYAIPSRGRVVLQSRTIHLPEGAQPIQGPIGP
jgi:hypothetical protein